LPACWDAWRLRSFNCRHHSSRRRAHPDADPYAFAQCDANANADTYGHANSDSHTNCNGYSYPNA
jgi:hypothetical protein